MRKDGVDYARVNGTLNETGAKRRGVRGSMTLSTGNKGDGL